MPSASIAAGRTTVKVVPFPSVLRTSIRPPAPCTMRWLIARPRPVPFSLVVKKGRKILSRALREMPGPGAAFSLASTGRAGALLSGAGFGGIEFVKADEPMLIGRDVNDVLEYERTSPTATEILTGLSPAQADELTRLVRDRLMKYASPDGVTMPGAAWLVTAQAV